MKTRFTQLTPRLNQPNKQRFVQLGFPLFIGMLLLLSLVVFRPHLATTENHLLNEINEISGQVTGSNGSLIQGAMIRAQERHSAAYVSALSDSNGAYTLTLGAGLWVISTHHSTSTVPNDWFWNQEPTFVDFFEDGENELRKLDFEFPLSQTVIRGFVKMDDGTTPPFDVIVSLKSAEGYGISRPARASDGFFWRIARSGTFTFQLLPQHPDYVGPAPQTYDLVPGEFIDLGELKLIRKSSAVYQSATDTNNNLIGGVQLLAYSNQGQTAIATTQPTATVPLKLVAGDWTIRPQIPANLPFLHDGEPVQVSVQANQSITMPAFALQPAPYLVSGSLADIANSPISLDGWLAAEDELGNEIRTAEIQDGSFSLYLPDGEYLLRPIVAPGSSYFATQPLRVTVSGQDLNLTMPLLSTNSLITGTLWDPREEEVVTGTHGLITVDSGESFQQSQVVSQTGGVRFRLPWGDWSLGYDLANGSTHLPLDRSVEVGVLATAEQAVDLPVAKIDAAVTGRVIAPNGDPVENVSVYVRGESAELRQVYIQDQTDEEGRYYIQLPHGKYTIWSDLGQTSQQGWVSPADQLLTIGIKGIRPGINFQFQNANVTVSGDLLLPDGSVLGQSAKLWAVSGLGEYVTGTVSAEGNFNLPLLTGLGWRIFAATERDGLLYRLEEPLAPTANQTLNLRFSAGTPIPSSQIAQFDAGKLAKIRINNDMTVLIPANTLPVTGLAMLVATPVATLADRIFNRQIGTGYRLTAFDQFGNPITTSYYQNIIVSLHYDHDHLATQKLREDTLRPGVFNLQSNFWEQPTHFVINKNSDTLSFESNYLGTYMLFAGEPQLDNIFLPLIRR